MKEFEEIKNTLTIKSKCFSIKYFHNYLRLVQYF